MQAAQLVEDRKKAGEPLGELPEKLRIRQDILSTPGRSIMQSTEPMDTDSPPSLPNQDSPHFRAQGRMQILPQQTNAPASHNVEETLRRRAAHNAKAM